MAEAGGATTQSGIYYQNSVAALALADLLELSASPPRDRVVEVRVESPDDVDDIIIRYADGHRQFLNVKSRVTPGSAPWVSLWKSLQAQFSQPSFTAEDQLTIVFEEVTSTARTLRDMCQRAASSVDQAEFTGRLAQPHTRLFESIEQIVSSPLETLELLRRTTVQLLPLDQIENEFDRRRLGGSFTLPAKLLSILRDIAGGGARRRSLFLSAPLRRRLSTDYDVKIVEPAGWGLSAYRDALGRLARIEIPGTGVSGSVDELFVWPRVRPYERTRPSDFEDEDPRDRFAEEIGVIDLREFPSNHLDRCVIIAGPGYGKSALLTAISGRLANSPYVPVLVPLASLAASDSGVIEFLVNQTNRELDINADWHQLAEQGLLVLLFDGLDEIPAGTRPALMRRIDTFSARYHRTPWMLTVRDPAVLIGASEAQLIEILPLEEDDISRFVATMQRRLSELDPHKFVTRLKMYPDLERLAKIPLFLAMLLATLNDVDSLPATRSDLIEAYLKTLFAPHEHKVMSGRHDKAVFLRDIAETLAFERLERQEIGASEREVRKIILQISETSTDAELLYQQLRANGILRQQSSIRLQFPFPIVQEYLAACHLVRHAPESLSNRIDDAVHRPWAQVIQFAIELLPEPTPVIRAILDRPDDAFCTGLRLVGRCVANGARVDHGIRSQVGDRLVAFWVRAPTRARERVGRLLTDGFSQPISPTLRAALHHHWLFHDGAGDIISNANDHSLTLSVLQELLDRKPESYTFYHSLKPALISVGDRAFKLIIKYTKAPDLTEGHLEGLASLMEHFSPGSVSRELALVIADDTRFSRKLRFRAIYVAGPPLETRFLSLINESLRSEESDERWAVSRLMEFHPDRIKQLNSALRDERISHDRKCELAGDLWLLIPDAIERATFMRTFFADAALDHELATIMRLFEARHGNQSAFVTLVDQIPENPIFLVGQTVALFGHYPHRELAERAADLANNRVNRGEDAVRIATSATTGMLYIYQMDYGFGGVLINTQPHAGTSRWMEIVEAWSERKDLTDVQRLTLLTTASQLGSERACARLEADVLALTNPDDHKYEEDDYGHAISSAIREVRRRRPLLPLNLASLWVLSKKANISFVSVGAIESHGDVQALELLIRLHGEVTEWHLKDMLANSIESLAAKLGVIVKQENRVLSIVY
ncbi:UNVERIFIED_CONTAM: NACHT domain-containing protein [Pseudomonas sp. CM11]